MDGFVSEGEPGFVPYEDLPRLPEDPEERRDSIAKMVAYNKALRAWRSSTPEDDAEQLKARLDAAWRAMDHVPQDAPSPNWNNCKE